MLVIFTTLGAAAQSNVVSNTSIIPTAVTDAFVKKFPTATNVEWDSKTTKNNTDIPVYHVTFDIGMADKDHDAWIDKDGKVLQHKKGIPAATLPDPVQLAVKNNFPSCTIGNAGRMEENGVASYVIEINCGTRVRAVMMDAEGNMKPDTRN